MGGSMIGTYSLLLCQVTRGAKDDYDCIILELRRTGEKMSVKTRIKQGIVHGKTFRGGGARGNRRGIIVGIVVARSDSDRMM